MRNLLFYCTANIVISTSDRNIVGWEIEMHIHYVETENDTVKPHDDTVNDTVFELIKQDKQITASEISQRLNISLSTAKRKIKELKVKGIIDRIGSDKKGYWRITGH